MIFGVDSRAVTTPIVAHATSSAHRPSDVGNVVSERRRPRGAWAAFATSSTPNRACGRPAAHAQIRGPGVAALDRRRYRLRDPPRRLTCDDDTVEGARR